MNLNIAAETERIVREELGRGHFRSIDDLIVASVNAWRELNPLQKQESLSGISDVSDTVRKEKARQFVEWAANQPYSPPLSDEAISRSSLNPDRG